MKCKIKVWAVASVSHTAMQITCRLKQKGFDLSTNLRKFDRIIGQIDKDGIRET